MHTISKHMLRNFRLSDIASMSVETRARLEGLTSRKQDLTEPFAAQTKTHKSFSHTNSKSIREQNQRAFRTEVKAALNLQMPSGKEVA